MKIYIVTLSLKGEYCEDDVITAFATEEEARACTNELFSDACKYWDIPEKATRGFGLCFNIEERELGVYENYYKDKQNPNNKLIP